MERISSTELTPAQETLLIPLWARAQESAQPDPILRDPQAVALLSAIDYPFERFAQARVSAASFCIRGTIFDRLVHEFLREQPLGTVVEIGAGLDTRFERLDNGTLAWFDLDLPDAMQLRQRLFAARPRRHFLSGSVLDDEWLRAVAATAPRSVLFVAEGVLYFLRREQVAALFGRLADHFPGARVIFDCQSPAFLMYNNLRQPVPNARMLWSLRRLEDIERWDSRLKVEKCVGFGDREYYEPRILRRLPWHQRLFRVLWPRARNMFRICVVRLG